MNAADFCEKHANGFSEAEALSAGILARAHEVLSGRYPTHGSHGELADTHGREALTFERTITMKMATAMLAHKRQTTRQSHDPTGTAEAALERRATEDSQT
ncbi:hypothetical protein [Nitrobacter sp. JJSN]|uniref:hypothetical protein n=1 Tax=Nitrobacter sp. JJSN TaxID=3453033 RepID=UPI003F771210